jgi:hypothetical protein
MSTPINQLPNDPNKIPDQSTGDDNDIAIQEILNQIQPQQVPSPNVMAAAAAAAAMQTQPVSAQPASSSMLNSILKAYQDDLQLAAVIAVVVFLAHFAPLDKYFGKYFQQVPYYELILRAVFVAIVVIGIKAFMLV